MRVVKILLLDGSTHYEYCDHTRTLEHLLNRLVAKGLAPDDETLSPFPCDAEGNFRRDEELPCDTLIRDLPRCEEKAAGFSISHVIIKLELSP